VVLYNEKRKPWETMTGTLIERKEQEMKVKKIFIVTGANGFLGNNVVRKLAENRENEVRALVLPEDRTASLEGLDCRVYRGDVTEKDTLDEVFEVQEQDGPLYVIHCAGIVYIKRRYDPNMYDVNVNGTKNIAEKALEKGAKLVCVSSVHAITELPGREAMAEIKNFDPGLVEGQYAKTKAETANYILEAVEKKGLNACIVHPSGMIGPYDFGNSHLTQLILDFASGRLRACVKGGYDFADVRDVAEGIISACCYGKKGECYILSNRYITVKELLDTISEVQGTKKIKTVLPMWLARLTAPLAELYYAILKQPPLFTKYSLYTLTSNANFSNEKAKRELGYRNRALKETIGDTVAWLRDCGRIGQPGGGHHYNIK